MHPNLSSDKCVFQNHQYLNNIDFPVIEEVTAQLLIGANVTHLFCMKAVRDAHDKGLPDAIKSPLGWSLVVPTLAIERSSLDA